MWINEDNDDDGDDAKKSSNRKCVAFSIAAPAPISIFPYLFIADADVK